MKIFKETKEQYITTGEFARIVKLNKKTLIYYDEIGLFKPAYVNEKGYRFYSIFQTDALALIIALRDLGIPLKDIKEYLSAGDAQALNDTLEKKEQEIDEVIETLRARKKLLNKVRSENMDYMSFFGVEYVIKEYPEEHYELFPDQPTKPSMVIMNYATDGAYTGFRVNDEGLKLYHKHDCAPVLIPAGKYLCYWGDTFGQYSTFKSRADGMKRYAAEQGLKIDSDFFIEFSDTMINPSDKEFFSIRVQIKQE